MRLFSGVIGAVEHARADGGDVLDTLDAQVGWWKVIQARPKIEALAALAVEDPLVSAVDRYGALLPRVRITELLREIDVLTGFSAMFRELRSGKIHDNPSCILAAVLADATNLGLERMANASQGVTYAQLAWTQSWYLSEKN